MGWGQAPAWTAGLTGHCAAAGMPGALADGNARDREGELYKGFSAAAKTLKELKE